MHSLDPPDPAHGAGEPEIRSQVLAGLIGVTNDGRGTAYFPFRNYSGPTFAGKTGTAQVANGKVDDTSWFVGFTNPDNDPAQPQYVVLAMVEQGGFGAEVAAPIARRIAEFLDRYPKPARSRSAAAEQEGLMGVTDGARR